VCKACGCPSGANVQIKFFINGYGNSNGKDIEKRLLALPGVYHVHIHAHDGQATIDYNPARTTLTEITNLLAAHNLRAII